jgi:hypothetical protein
MIKYKFNDGSKITKDFQKTCTKHKFIRKKHISDFYANSFHVIGIKKRIILKESIKPSKKRRNPDYTGKIQTTPEKSRQHRKNPDNTGKIQTRLKKSRLHRKNPDYSGKIQTTPEKSMQKPEKSKLDPEKSKQKPEKSKQKPEKSK